MREEIQDYISENDNKKDFYHVFHDKIHKFKIAKGDRVKLMDVVEFVNKKLASEDGMFFFGRLRPRSEQIIRSECPSEVNLVKNKSMSQSTIYDKHKLANSVATSGASLGTDSMLTQTKTSSQVLSKTVYSKVSCLNNFKNFDVVAKFLEKNL